MALLVPAWLIGERDIATEHRGIAFLPCAGLALAFAHEDLFRYPLHEWGLSVATLATFWVVAIALPLVLAFLL